MHRKSCKEPQESQAETIPNASSLNNSKPSSTDNATSQGSKRTVEVDFSELEDGTVVEMIENPQDAKKSIFATWSNGQVRHVEKLECGNQVLVPVPRDAGMIRHVRLATGTEPYESARALLELLIYFLHYTLELSGEQKVLLSSLVMSTWVVEKLPVAPYVAFLGPPGSGKTTALRILNLLCRRSLLTADISSPAFYELCDRMTTTLLIDETATVDNRRKILHLLRVGSTQGLVAVRKGHTYKSYGARAVSWIELPDDPALNSRCLLIPMAICKRTDLLAPTDPRVLRLAERLQRRLLQFRLMNFKTLRLPQISGEKELQPRTRDLFRALALPLGEEKEICEVLLKLLKQQESVRELLSVPQSAVLELLYDAIHTYPEFNAVKMSELTECVNANLRERGEVGNLKEKRVGNILTSLNLTNRQRLNSGFVLWLDRQTREQIHSLARMYRVNAGLTSEMSARCKLCQITSADTADGSTPKSSEKGGRAEAKSSRERGELREHGKRTVRGKSAQAVRAVSPVVSSECPGRYSTSGRSPMKKNGLGARKRGGGPSSFIAPPQDQNFKTNSSKSFKSGRLAFRDVKRSGGLGRQQRMRLG